MRGSRVRVSLNVGLNDHQGSIQRVKQKKKKKKRGLGLRAVPAPSDGVRVQGVRVRKYHVLVVWWFRVELQHSV